MVSVWPGQIGLHFLQYLAINSILSYTFNTFIFSKITKFYGYLTRGFFTPFFLHNFFTLIFLTNIFKIIFRGAKTNFTVIFFDFRYYFHIFDKYKDFDDNNLVIWQNYRFFHIFRRILNFVTFLDRTSTTSIEFYGQLFVQLFELNIFHALTLLEISQKNFYKL